MSHDRIDRLLADASPPPRAGRDGRGWPTHKARARARRRRHGRTTPDFGRDPATGTTTKEK